MHGADAVVQVCGDAVTPLTPAKPKRPQWSATLTAIFAAAALLLAANAAATQYLAQRAHYHPALGAPWFGHIYAPWAWLGWRANLAALDRGAFDIVSSAMAGLGALTALTALVAMSWRERRALRHDDVHGTAHWASRAEIEATGLLPRKGRPGAGVYVGGWTDKRGRLHYLRHNGPEHIAAIAPTRSGKGVGLVVPTLLSWPHSVVVNDQKGELWNMTAGWRSKDAGNAVLRFDPGAVKGSVKFNPLEEIRLGTIHEVGDAQNLVTNIVDPDGKGLVDHWAKTAHAFLTGVVLHVLYKAQAAGRTGALPDVALALSDPARPVEALYEEMLANRWPVEALYRDIRGDIEATHPIIAAAARDMTNRPDEERGSVLSTAMSFLSLYRDPLVARNTARSDFTIMDLMNHTTPVSLYLVVRAEDKDRMKPLMRLIINQLVRVLMRPELREDDNGKPLPPHKHRLLLMLDEFPSYGKLEVFQEAMAYIAGYGLKAYLIMQDVAQLWGAYGRDESITSNCNVRVAYAPNKIETAEWLSRMLGTMTVVKEDVTTSGGRFSAVLSSVSKTYHEVSRPLATPDEIMRLKSPVKDENDVIVEPGDMLVFAAGHAPIYGTQSLYFRDPVFSARAKLPRPKGDVGLVGARRLSMRSGVVMKRSVWSHLGVDRPRSLGGTSRARRRVCAQPHRLGAPRPVADHATPRPRSARRAGQRLSARRPGLPRRSRAGLSLPRAVSGRLRTLAQTCGRHSRRSRRAYARGPLGEWPPGAQHGAARRRQQRPPPAGGAFWRACRQPRRGLACLGLHPLQLRQPLFRAACGGPHRRRRGARLDPSHKERSP